MQQEKYKDVPEVFMFINSGSGGGIGKELIALNKDFLVFDVPASQYPRDKNNIVTVNLHLFDLKNSQRRNKGFQELKQLIQEKTKVILVICGGDGTVMWVVSQLHNHDIDHLKVPVAMLPLGTGNDFSRVLEWGKECPPDLLEDDFAKLKKRVTYWMSAEQDTLDIWMVQAEVQDYGKFEKVSNQKTQLMEEKVLKKHFCNYFSVGIDGKVGYSFDLHRTSSRIGNLLVYGVMGTVKSMTKTKNLGQLTRQFKQNSLQISITKNQGESARQMSASDKPILQRGSMTLEDIKSHENILFLNINSFMAGTKDIWKNAEQPESVKEKMNPQSHSDGKIQVLSFNGVWSLAMQKMISGFPSKVFQGTGPFTFEFNQFPRQGKHRTYLQIDGEFIRYTHPKSFVVQRSDLSKSGKIRILKRVPLERQKGCCC